MISHLRAPPWLQEAWIRRLRWHYSFYNDFYAEGKLRPPLILIGLGRERLGEWNGTHRTVTISESHILDHSWESVLDTLRHEMAHQYVEEVFRLPGSPPHGEAFARACRILRVEPARAAVPGGVGPPGDSLAERDQMLQRIKELLAMAGSPNEHEAATAMRLVHKYLLKYNLELADVEAKRSYATRHLGTCSARIQEYEYTLAHILKEHFFVEVVWVFSYDPLRDLPGRILQIAGTPENLEIAEYVHRYVMNLTGPLWEAHRRANPTGGGTRNQYLAGLLRGFSDKLDGQRGELRQEYGLIWRGDPLLKEFYRFMNPRLRKLGGSGVSRSEDYDAGLRDGKEITIRRGVTGEAARRGRLIGDGR